MMYHPKYHSDQVPESLTYEQPLSVSSLGSTRQTPDMEQNTKCSRGELYGLSGDT